MANYEDLLQSIDRIRNGEAGCIDIILENENILIIKMDRPSVIPETISSDQIIILQKYSEKMTTKVFSHQTSTPSRSIKSAASIDSNNKFSFKDDLDITGSPLKCHFAVDNLSPFVVELTPSGQKRNINKLNYNPLPIAKVRKIASKLLSAMKKNENQLNFDIPIWFACDAKDNKKTFFLGLHRDEHSTTRTSLTTSGPFNDLEEIPTLDRFKSELYFGCSSKRVDATAHAVYEILKGDSSASSSFKLISTWKNPQSILSSPSLNATTLLDLSIKCSDAPPEISNTYRELLLLKGFIDGLTTGEIPWVVLTETSSVKDELTEVFNILRSPGKTHESNEKNEQEELNFWARNRSFDFTDMLWNALIKCTSYEELVHGLNMVFDAITSGFIRPQIHVRNTTQIGCEARTLMKGGVKQLELTGIRPIQMLIEIGLEKLKRDYMHFFHLGKFATNEQLMPFINKASNLEQPLVCLKKIEQLHVALHTVVIISNFIEFPPGSLVQYSSKILSNFKDFVFETTHHFEFTIQTSYVKELIINSSPIVWQVTLINDEDSFSKILMLQVSPDKLMYEKDEDLDYSRSEEMVERPLYCNICLQVKDSLFF